MGAIDLILNLAALLLWLNWRSRKFDPLARASAASLAGTLKRAETRPAERWRMVAALGLLLFGRAVVYWMIGAPAQWTPKLHLGAVVLAFRVDVFLTALLYSLLGFARVLVVFYFWLLVMAGINRSVTEADLLLKLLRLQLGPVGRWPWPVQALVVPLAVAGAWACLYPLLVFTNVLAPAGSLLHWVEQTLMLSAALVLTLRFLLPVLLLVYFVTSYVYLGKNLLWEFIGGTAANLLKPLRGLPLRAGKLDLRPIVATALILLVMHWVPRYLESRLSQEHIVLWPQ